MLENVYTAYYNVYTFSVERFMKPECLGFFTNPNKPGALERTMEAFKAASQAGFKCSVDAQIAASLAGAPKFDELHPDVILAFGGDGTILRSAPAALKFNAPILGVNLGRIGFLSEVDPSTLNMALECLVNGKYEVDERMMLRCTINGEMAFDCLNEALLYKKSFSGIAEISVVVDGTDAGRVFCDGLVISTPTGATGYSISAGGPVIAPGLDAAIITPICPHTLGFRPIMVSDRAKVEFKVYGSGLVAVDGVYVADVTEADDIRVERSENSVSFIRFARRNLYSLIKDRLA